MENLNTMRNIIIILNFGIDLLIQFIEEFKPKNKKLGKNILSKYLRWISPTEILKKMESYIKNF